MYRTIRLKEGKEASIHRRHQWIFSGAIDFIDKKIQNGDVVEVVDSKNQFLAIGYYYNSSISIKILTFNKETIDHVFWKEKIKRAFFYRYKSLNLPNASNNAFRLINAEGDGIPGLIVDIYDDLAVVQCYNDFILNNIEKIVAALKNLPIEIKHIYNKSKNTLRNSVDGFIEGKCNNDKVILENGLGFEIDFMEGQKTGFFLDQRENRKFVEQLSQKRKVLNLFSYTGAFSVYALSGQADEVVSVDISQTAIDLARKNVEINFGKTPKAKFVISDVFEYLQNEENRYDLIILDPPAFAKTMDKQDIALQTYRKLNEAAMRLLEKNGILLTFSCSQVVPRDRFKQATFVAAANIKRNCRILKNLYQYADHPIDLYHQESEYLKGFAIYFD